MASRMGARIRDLRRRRQMTQVALAKALGIRPAPLCQIEGGHHIPSGRLLYRLATVLEVSVDSLFADPGSGEAGYVRLDRGDGIALHRRSLLPGRRVRSATAADAPVATLLPPMDPGTSPGALSLLADRVGDLASAFLALEDACGALKRASVPLMLPFEPTEPGIEKLVGQVRYFLGIGQAVIFDYLELLENAGLRILFVELPDDLASCVAYDHVNGNVFLLVRDNLTTERRLFRLLFELGRVYYFTLGTGSGRALPPRSANALDELHTARKFAALFLMPANTVRATVRQLGIGPNAWTWELLIRIKHRFGVSLQAFAFRLRELGLISRALDDRFRAQVLEYYEQHGPVEPGDSRRILTPNGRLGDLRLLAETNPAIKPELPAIDAVLTRFKISMP